MRASRGMVFAVGMLLALPAAARDVDIGSATLSMNHKLTLAGGWRVEGPDDGNLGKQNVPGQMNLCAPDDCLSFSDNPAPNNRLKGARGGFFFGAVDDGDMNYDAWDPYVAMLKANADWVLNWGDWTFKSTFIGFFDAVNADFSQTENNTLYQSSGQARDGGITDKLAIRGEFRELFATTTFDVLDYEVFFSIGRQRLRWGEANLTLFNTLDVINPQDGVLGRQPGFNANELNLPVGLLSMGTDLVENLTFDMFYQLEWRAVRAEPSSSFFSTQDAAGGGSYAVIGLGQYPEDPHAQFVSQGTSSLVSNSHRTIYLDEREASNSGQYGLRLKWYLPEFNNGTELGFYYANYHSRLPYLSANAAQDSCMRNATNIVDAAIMCNGFNSARTAGAERCEPPGCIGDAAYLAREPLPVDTMQLFLEYPEDIQMYGISFNTTLGGWSVAGEYTYRPNLPAQIMISDVVLAATQPAFSRVEVPLDGLAVPESLAQFNPTTLARVLGFLATIQPSDIATGTALPGARVFAPDYTTAYRGYDNSSPATDLDGGSYIQGYERLQVGQFALTALQLFSTNPVGSDDVLVLGEVGFSHVLNMPERGQLYMQGAGDQTHPSPGADCSGNVSQTPGTGDCTTRRINPTQQTEGFADDFSWGVRGLVQLNYSNVMDWGFNVKPTLIAFYDVDGISPSPMQNYVEGNIWLIPGAFFEFGAEYSGSLLYQFFDGERNLLSDRDSLSFTFSYSF